jgi:hypothetical protein
VQEIEVQRAELLFFLGEFGLGIKGAKDVRHGLGGSERFFADTSEVEVELRVREVRSKIGGQFESEGGLADSALALEARDVDTTSSDSRAEFVEFGLASDKVVWGWRELVDGTSTVTA